MPEWVVSFGSAMIGGLVTAGMAFGAMRAEVRHARRDLEKVKSRQENLDDKFVTRREFEVVMKAFREDVHSISTSIGAVRDYLLANREEGTSRGDL